jgi:hypothetical protein
MRKILIFFFVILIAVSLLLAFLSFEKKEWETLTATISLIIAVISGWIAYEAFYRQSLTDKPQVILKLDTKSRYGVILLVAENLGTKPAFNIKFTWDQELLNQKGEKITFNKYNNNIDIPVLNPNESTSVIIDTPHAFYEKNRDKNLNFGGMIDFQESLNSKRKVKYPFHFSFGHYGLTPTFENEELKMAHELIKIPQKLEEISKVLKEIIEIYNDNKPSA